MLSVRIFDVMNCSVPLNANECVVLFPSLTRVQFSRPCEGTCTSHSYRNGGRVISV